MGDAADLFEVDQAAGPVARDGEPGEADDARARAVDRPCPTARASAFAGRPRRPAAGSAQSDATSATSSATAGAGCPPSRPSGMKAMQGMTSLEQHKIARVALHKRGPNVRSARAGVRSRPRRMSRSMLVLGIDPGTASTGYGIVRSAGSRLQALEEGVIETRAGVALERRLAQIHAARRRAARRAPRPTRWRSRSCTSAPTSGRRSRSGRRAASCCWPPASAASPSRSYTPQQVKSAVCGNGRADKDQVARMVARLLGLAGAADPDHAADALAVAICDLNRAPLAARGRDGVARSAGVIALISGTVAVRRADHVVVDCGGVGYRLAVSAETLKHVPAVGQPVTLHTHLVVRDDALALYGFATEEERDLFLMLLGSSRSGPKVALAVLSGAPPRSCWRPSRPATSSMLQAAPGVGKRTAERIIVELREKVGAACPTMRSRSRRGDDPRALAREALLGLGYGVNEIDELLAGAARRCKHRGADRARAAERAAMSARRHLAAARAPGRQLPSEELETSIARCARAGWRTSSARRRSRTSSRSRSRPPRAAARRSTTCCSPARRGSARPRWRRSSPPSSASPFVQTAGPALERKGDVASFLTALEPRAVFFVDEIHRLPRALEETFYPAMEDAALPITVGQGAGARVVTLPLPPFTLIGATTRTGLLTTPLRDRFGIQHRLEHYEPDELAADRAALGAAARRRDRGRRRGRDREPQPRHAAGRQPAAQARPRLRRGPPRRRRHARTWPATALDLLEVDHEGLDRLDREILRAICEKFGGGPVGPLDARGRGRRGAGHDRGRLRALPAPAGADRAHAARAGGDPARLRAPRPGASPARDAAVERLASPAAVTSGRYRRAL